MAGLRISMCERATLYVLPGSKTSKHAAAANDRPMHAWVPQLADTANHPLQKYSRSLNKNCTKSSSYPRQKKQDQQVQHLYNSMIFPRGDPQEEFRLVLYRISVRRGAPLNPIPTPIINPLLPPKVTTYPSQCSVISQSVNPPLEFQRGRRGSKLWDAE